MTPIEYVMLANAILQGVGKLIEAGQRMRQAARNRGEWTEEEERAFDEQLERLKGPLAPAHWVPEKPA